MSTLALERRAKRCPGCGDGDGWYVPVVFAATGATVNCETCNSMARPGGGASKSEVRKRTSRAGAAIQLPENTETD